MTDVRRERIPLLWSTVGGTAMAERFTGSFFKRARVIFLCQEVELPYNECSVHTCDRNGSRSERPRRSSSTDGSKSRNNGSCDRSTVSMASSPGRCPLRHSLRHTPRHTAQHQPMGWRRLFSSSLAFVCLFVVVAVQSGCFVTCCFCFVALVCLGVGMFGWG